MSTAKVVREVQVHVVTVSGVGPVGRDGMDGTGSTPTYTTGAALSGHRMVILDASRQAVYADNTTLAHASRVLGLTTGAAAAGAQVPVVREVELQEPSWSWTVGGAIYLGAGGNLIQSNPVSPALFSLCVGFATASDRMFISVGMPIILS